VKYVILCVLHISTAFKCWLVICCFFPLRRLGGCAVLVRNLIQIGGAQVHWCWGYTRGCEQWQILLLFFFIITYFSSLRQSILQCVCQQQQKMSRITCENEILQQNKIHLVSDRSFMY